MTLCLYLSPLFHSVLSNCDFLGCVLGLVLIFTTLFKPSFSQSWTGVKVVATFAFYKLGEWKRRGEKFYPKSSAASQLELGSEQRRSWVNPQHSG